MSAQRNIRFGLAVAGSVGSFALSWPYWRNFEYWAESHSMWLFYFVLGFVLAIYVFYVFLDSLETLFEHDALERQAQVVPAEETPASPEDAR
ncbi:hypothetical protein [Mesorhizobium sp. A623]